VDMIKCVVFSLDLVISFAVLTGCKQFVDWLQDGIVTVPLLGEVEYSVLNHLPLISKL